MPTNIWLTDEDADIEGYLRAKLGSRSDAASLVRAVTNTEAGPSSGVQATRSAGGTALAWITDPLDGTDLTAAAWTLHLWAKESAAAANAAIRVQVLPYTNAEGAAALDNNAGTELGTTIKDVAITTGVASITTMADGDRLVVKVLFDDAASPMGAGETCTLAYNGLRARAEGDSYVTCPDTLAVTAAVPTATRTQVRQNLKDTHSTEPLLSDAEVNQAIASALRQYSGDRPYQAAHLYDGDGATYDYRLPPLWAHGFSAVAEIEYPAGEQRREVLENEDWEVVETVLGVQPVRKLRFVTQVPESGTDNVVVRYTARHVHTDELDTVPADDLGALCWLAAGHAALTMSAKQAASSDPIIAADSTDHRNGSDVWRSVANACIKRYEEHMGQGNVAVAAASRTQDMDTNLSGGHDRLFHGRRRR